MSFFTFPICFKCCITIEWLRLSSSAISHVVLRGSASVILSIDRCQLPMVEKAMASHSSTLAWKIPWTEEPGRLQSMGLRRVGHDWATSLSLFTFVHWRRKWQPTPLFLPGEYQGWGAWWAAIYGVTQSRTQLKWLGSSSSKQDGKSEHWQLRNQWTKMDWNGWI